MPIVFPMSLLGNAASSEVRNGIVMWGQRRSKDPGKTGQVPPPNLSTLGEHRA